MPQLYLQNRPTFASGLAQGIEAMGGLAANSARSALARQQIKQQDKYAAAVDEFGKTGDPDVFKGADPEAWAKIKQYTESQPPQEIAGIVKAADYMGAIRGAINPQTWPGIKQTMEKNGLVKPGMLPDQYDEGKINQFAFAGKLMQSQIKAAGQAPTTLVDASGKPVGQVPGKVVPLPQQTTLVGPQGPVGKVSGPVHNLPQPSKEPKETMDEKGYKQYLTENPKATILDYQRAKAETKGTTPEDRASLVEGLADGTISPNQLSKRALDYNKIIAEAKRQGVDIEKAQNQFYAAQRSIASLNSDRMVRFKTLINTGVHTIDEVDHLSKQMNLSGFHPLNYAEIEGLTKTAGNTPSGQLATQYINAVNFLKEDFAQIAMGGYAPTESVWNLVNNQIKTNYGVNQMHSSLIEIKRLLNYRDKAMQEVAPTMPVGTGRESSPAAPQQTAPSAKSTWQPGQPRTIRYQNRKGEDVTDQLSDDVYKATVEHHSQ